MYLDNKYTKVYNSIVSRAKSRKLGGYLESHHIVPKSMGGSNTKDNLVKLTAREHFVCHRLLVKMVTGKHYFQMCKALHMMTVRNSHQQDRPKINSRSYAVIKANAAEAMSKLSKGIPKHTDRSKQILSEKAKGRPSPFKGKNQPDSAKQTLSALRSKPCISPSGERFASTKDAGVAYDMSGSAIQGHIKRGKSGWRYERIEDQQAMEDRRAPEKKRTYLPQTKEHVSKRVEARKKNGHYKDRESTIQRMSVAAKNRSKLR